MSKEIISEGEPFVVEYVSRAGYGAKRLPSITVDDSTGDVLLGSPDGSGNYPIRVRQSDSAVLLKGTAAASSITGDVTAAGDLTMAADKSILANAGTGRVDLSSMTGLFKTPTGAGTLSGTTTLAANKNLLCSAGTSALDLSLGTGVTKTTTGVNTIGGKVASTATAWQLADPGNAGAISVATNGVCNMTSAGAETRTLAIPTFIGQQITLMCDTYVGNIVVTVASAFDSAAHTTITFGAAGKAITLVGVTLAGTRCWRLVGNDGTTLG